MTQTLVSDSLKLDSVKNITFTITSGEQGEATKAKADANVETGEKAPISVRTLRAEIRAGLKPYEDNLDSIKI